MRIIPSIPADYVDMGRSNEMQSNYAPVKVAKVVGVLPAHYPVICWVITESRGVRLCLSVTTLQVINELKTTRAFFLTTPALASTLLEIRRQ